MRADLHVHSSASDGTDPPAEVMRRAALAGLDVVALTDHDTVAGHAEARAAADPVMLLPGMELSCRLDGRSLHMLAYVFDPDQPDLAAELTRIPDDRGLRAPPMLDRPAGRAAGGVTVLAHPRAGRDTRVTDEQITGLAAAGLAGLEVFHPDQSDTERARLLALAHDLDLVATGGSDDHGGLTDYRLGCETTP